jgi:uncharacterized protein (UPF0335 family)
MKISSTVAVAVIAAAGVSITSAAQLKEGVQTPPGEHEVALRRELAAARAELEVMQRRARDASAQAHALANTAAKQAQTLKEQQQIDEALEAAQRVIEGYRAEAILWGREKTAGAHPSIEASQVAAKRALDEERHKVERLEQELTTARQTIDALMTAANLAAGVSIASAAQLKEGVQTPPGEHEVALRRELAAARAELEVMQRGARDASAQAHALANTAAKQEQALKEQQQIAEALEAAQRVIEGYRAEAVLWGREKAAGAPPSIEASQVAAKGALDEERHKVERLEQELTTARQTIDALKTAANLAAVEKTNAMKDRSVAETALKQAGEALELERERADSAVHDLDIVRRERDALKQNSMELSAALDQEREKAIGLARSLSAARKAIDIAKGKHRTAAVERAPKARTPASTLANTLSRSGVQPARKPGLPKKQKVKVQRSPQLVLPATIALPASLLPTRPPKSSTRASEDQ